MKNPFPRTVTTEPCGCRHPMCTKHGLSVTANHQGSGFSNLKEAQYAANAINQHDALVAMLTRIVDDTALVRPLPEWYDAAESLLLGQ